MLFSKAIIRAEWEAFEGEAGGRAGGKAAFNLGNADRSREGASGPFPGASVFL
jgi:hypothetical protein